MKISKFQTANLKNKILFVRTNWQTICLISILLAAVLTFSSVSAQDATEIKSPALTLFRVGERFSYNISFGQFKNAGVAEIYVASRGKLGERDAVEIQSKIKTTNLVSAAFYLLDETRTTFAAVETGLPLYVRKTSNSGVLPKETINNFLVAPTANFDLITLIYQARNAGGIGNFPLQEDDKNYMVSLQSAGNEKIKTVVGEFETNISTAQSQFFVEKGITNLRINFTSDEARIPVLIRFKTLKGEFSAEIAGLQVPKTPTPTPVQTPRPQTTPKPTATPPLYIDNAPLLPDLAFKLGESLEYQISVGGKYLGIVTLQAKERKKVNNQDSLLLTATVTATQPDQQILNLNDSIQTRINPNTLAPFDFNAKFNGLFNVYNQIVGFNQSVGKATVNGTNLIDIPVGTHNLLSLAYAVRSFNLKPSLIVKNPVNDTRVAVLVGATASVFILKPDNAEILTIKGEKVSAQLISVTTGNPQLDSQNLQIRIWLSNDEKRVPLRLMIGNYQADLVSQNIIPLK